MSTERTTNGPINSVACPHCGKRNDFRTLQEEQLLDTGAVVNCDFCQRLQEVVRVQPIVLVTVRKAMANAQRTMLPGAGGRGLPPARQATTLTPAQTRRLLRGG
jgi:hypothetical protein